MIKLNKQEVVFGKFPNGETNLPLEDLFIRSYNRITWVYEGDEEFFKLHVLKNWLDDQLLKSSLTIMYMPHSRMDRASKEYAFSLLTATKMVNSMGFDSIEVIEPHSDVTPALLNRCDSYEWCESKLDQVIKETGADSLFFPDGGAAKRYSSPLPYAVGIKQRDFKTGEITSFDLVGDVGTRVLIVDDLCSKGGTFIHSKKLLRREKVFCNVSLLVAHCENTVFTGELFSHIDMMYTSKDNILSRTHPRITLI